jgi:hypothetical protein
MSKTSYLLALTLILGGVAINSVPRAEAQNIDKFCSKFSRKISQGKAYEANGRKLALYRANCLGGNNNGFSSNPGNYSSNNGYTYTRGSTTGSNDGNGSSRSSQSTYSSNTTNGGNGGSYTQQRSSQTNSSYDSYDDDYRDDGGRYDDRPSINVATPNSQVRVQNGGVTIRTRNTEGTGINLGF